MKNKLQFWLTICLSVTTFYAVSQVDTTKIKSDTLKLPFVIHDEKMLSAEDLANKKEGTYITGVPDLSSDPVNGFGYGAEGTIFFNGKKSDPFFKYTAYRAKIDIALFNTTKSQRELKMAVDIPYMLNTKWRFRGEMAYEVNPNLLYFGINSETSLQGLSYVDANNPNKLITNANYSDYECSLTGVNQFLNTYQKREAILNVSMERSFLEGRLRTLIGFEAASLNITTFQGNSLLLNDFNAGKISGLGKSTITFAQLGLIYDSRDLETDPSNGMFAELTNELSLKVLGSNSNFNKTFGHINYYHKVFPSLLKKLIFASRFALGYTAGNSPFFEYQDQWSSEGSIEGLGGGATLRGYKQSRFLDRITQFNNVEFRYRFAQLTLLKQHLAFSAVPFLILVPFGIQLN